ncbi:ABC transporter permease [Roseivirga sp. E12]|uniref:ABC transporter permease n=1 Tax=Roseivirga sp. E12 TaxID=2819237 RepID=UPI001ABCB276|nr:ABC transporter permease [Roseivirga sp. E12]MBO3697461.1 ABC transporter permease [Roseivirga sp. E12]
MNNIIRFLKSGMKSLKRERFFAVVNIIGLSLGMYCFLVTSLYVHDELTHDKWHTNAENIYMPKITMSFGESNSFNLFPPVKLGEAMTEDLPGVIDAVNISLAQTINYKFKDEDFKSDGFYYTQPNLFNVFDFELKYGNVETALATPDDLIISSEIAQKHFPGLNPVGEFIEIINMGTFRISGVLKPIPSNSHLQFEFLALINMKVAPYDFYVDKWSTGTGLNYILTRSDYTAAKLLDDTKRVLATKDSTDSPGEYNYTKFTDLYMDNETMRSSSNAMFGGQMKYVYIFSLIGGLLLLVACFNYINLTTARSFARSKDVAVRKIIGATKTRLVLFQMGETLFLALLALIIAIVSVEVTLPGINSILDKSLALDFVNNIQVLWIPIALLSLVVLISGLYPALTVSAFSLSSVLRGSSPKSSKAIFRKALIVLQFLICAGLLSSALIIRGQAQYLVNMDLGYNEENIIGIDLTKAGMFEKYLEFKTEVGRIPQIEGVSGSPLPRLNSIINFEIGEGEEKLNLTCFYGAADRDFNDLFGLEFVYGSGFDGLTDSQLSTAVIINEAALKLLGWEGNPVGRELIDGKIVQGVAKDFHYMSGKSEIGPILIDNQMDQIRNLQVKFREGDRAAVELQLQNVWESFATNGDFELEEVEDYFADSYGREESLVNIFDLLTGLLMVVAFLGLFALSTFENQLREKEMSIRKVLGASYLNLIRVLNKKFTLLIVLALLISVPTSYLLINKWLVSFPYRIDSVVPYFAIAVGSVLLLSVVILGVHSYFNTQKNPANVLRNE